jgi:hypothetical protein
MIGSSNLLAHAEAIRRMALAASNEETKACWHWLNSGRAPPMTVGKT